MSMQEEAKVSKRKAEEAAAYIRERCPRAETAIVLGSGLMALAERLHKAVRVSYRDIPYFPETTVADHTGELAAGELGGKPVLMLCGRCHYYEGHHPQAVVFPVRVMAELGVRQLILTNAAGGVNADFKPGSLMHITDHINLMGFNPLVGPNLTQWGTRFPDLSQAYDPELGALAQQTARELGIQLHHGVYTAFSGPSYETPAEVRMVRMLGGDAVGMSTVPETLAARHMGLRVLGISCITNPAAGVADGTLDHQEVLAAGKQAEADFCALLTAIVARIG